MSTENLKELRNALSCWQDDYDCDDDKEQYDMFGAAIDAVSRLEAAERANYAQSDHINQQQDRIDSLEQKNAALGNALGTAERERDELREEQAEHDEQISRMEGKFSLAKRALDSKAARCDRAEVELARRDAAAGEPIAWQYRYNDGKVGDWHTVDSESECNHHPFYERRPIYSAAQPAVLRDIEPLIEGALKLHGLLTAVDGHSQLSDGFRNGARWAAKELGARQQKVVELPETHWTFDDDKNPVLDADEVIAALDAANVKWEVKK